MNYKYALRGDGQIVTQSISKEEQSKALEAIIATIDPAVLLLPERITKLIPPRPSGYEYSKELFKKRTGLAFDALSPAETAADMPLSFLFNSERMNRMVEYQVQNGGLGLDEMIDKLINITWKAPRRKGMEGLIQLQTEQVLLTYLLAASIDDNNSFITKSVIQKTLNDLKIFIELKKKSSTENTYAGHLLLALERMKAPEKVKPTIHVAIPPGSPIGCEED
jgi:Met-zincin